MNSNSFDDDKSMTQIIDDINKMNEPMLGTLNSNNTVYNVTDNYTFKCDAVKGLVEQTPLSDIFFSEKNVDYIDSQVRYKVKDLTGKIIDSIKSPELLSMMRDIFIENKNISGNKTVNDIKINYKKLNDYIILNATSKTISGISEYNRYINDISTTGYNINDRPEWAGNVQQTFDLSSTII